MCVLFVAAAELAQGSGEDCYEDFQKETCGKYCQTVTRLVSVSVSVSMHGQNYETVCVCVCVCVNICRSLPSTCTSDQICGRSFWTKRDCRYNVHVHVM